MRLNKEALSKIEKILARGNTVELKACREGVKIFEVRRTIEEMVAANGQ